MSSSFPASFGQERIWFAGELDRSSPVFNELAAVPVAAAVPPDAIERAFGQLVARHETLRTCLALNEHGELRQLVQAEVPVAVQRVDLAELAPAVQAPRFGRLVEDLVRRPIRLDRAPLWQATLVDLGPQGRQLLVVIHHTVFDGASVEVFRRELTELCEAATTGRPPGLAPLPVQYADVTVFQRNQLDGVRPAAGLDFWRRELAGAPLVHSVPTDRLRPPRESFAGADVVFDVPPELLDAVRGSARTLRVSDVTVLLAAWAALIGRISAQDDVVIGLHVAGRDRRELAALIGMFVNTVPIRSRLGGLASFADTVRRLRDTLREVRAHQDIPLQKIVEACLTGRDPSASPLFQIAFNHLDHPGGALNAGHGTSQQDLTLELSATSGRIEYRTDLFDEGTVRTLAARYLRLLAAAVAAPATPVRDLPLMDDEERALVTRTWADGPRVERPEVALTELLRDQARRTPDRVAVSFDGHHLSYAELRSRVDTLAGRLPHGAVVGVCSHRSPELVIALCSVLEAGAVHLPLDPELPIDRVSSLIADSGCQVVVTGPGAPAADRLPTHLTLVPAATARPPSGSAPDGGEPRVASRVRPDDAAYLIYTSGSTGRPKGVITTHRAVANRLRWLQDRDPLGPDDVVVQKTPIGFDVSVWEFLWPLIAGARLVVARPGDHRDPHRLRQVFVDESVTTAHFVPSMLAVFVGEGQAAGCPSLRRVICSGEELPAGLAAAFLAQAPDCALHNLYGPTEAAIEVSAWTVRPQDGEGRGRVPIGYPIDNVSLSIIDAHGEPVPPGVLGELCIGGVAVARGYLGRPALTARSFVPDPFGAPGATRYRTGDLARWRPDGAVEYLGRRDDQVKIRGVRVELGEVEQAMRAHPGVLDAAAVLRADSAESDGAESDGAESDGAGQQRLVGYVVAGPDEPGADAAGVRQEFGEAVRRTVAGLLPAAAVPAAIVVLAELAVNANGKLDRRALPAPDRQRAVPRADRPRTATERVVAAIWADELAVHTVGRDQDFFALGGHSLLAVRVMSRLGEATGAQLGVRVIFEGPSVAEVAAAVDAHLEAAADDRWQPARSPLRRRPVGSGSVDDPLPLTRGQERLWFLHEFDPLDAAFAVPVIRRLRGPLAIAELQQALDSVVDRQEALRMRFPATDGRPAQVAETSVRIAVELVDVSGAADPTSAAEAVTGAFVARPFDLAAGPLLRAAVVLLAPDDQLLVLVMHHIISDGVSSTVLLDELASFYNGGRAGAAHTPPPLAISYGDYVAWHRQATAADDRRVDHWRRRLAGASVLELVTDRPRPAVRSSRGGRVTLDVPADVAAAFHRLAGAEHASLFTALLAAFQLLLSRQTGQTDVCVGSTSAGRDHPELEPIIGNLLQTLVLRGDLGGDPTFRELLRRTRSCVGDALHHQDVPFEQLIDELRPARDLSRTALFQVMFVLQPPGGRRVGFDGLTDSAAAPGGDDAPCDLSLAAWPQDDGSLHTRWIYAADLFDEASVRRLADRFAAVLAELVTGADRPVSHLPMLTVADRRDLARWSSGPADSTAANRAVLAAFDRQVETRPDAVAVEFGDQRLSYAELDARVTRIAAALRRRQAASDALIGVCLPRSPDLVAVLLACWRAGAGYLPLDPGYPDERLRLLVGDAEVALVVTTDDHLDRFAGAPVTTVGRLSGDPAGSSHTGPEPTGPVEVSDAEPAGVAYLIYTSGSTGTPKGVLVPHRAVAARVAWMREAYRLGPADRVLQFAATSFDTHVEEIFPALAAGATLVLLPVSGELLPEFLTSPAGATLTVLDLPTAYWHELMAAHDQTIDAVCWPPALRLLVVGGDQVRAAAVQTWLQVGPAGAELLNTYGPTETTVVATSHRLTAQDTRRRPPIGRPLADTRVQVVDAALNPVGVGVPGELCIGGAGVAHGYLGRAGATARSFVPELFLPESRPGERAPTEAPAGRMYRTGDRVRWCEDGVLEFLGRIDDQFKVRGYRVEPGEIEAALLTDPAVAGAAVIARALDSGPQVVAYLVAAGAEPLDPERLRHRLSRTLPAHLVPAAFVVLDRLPHTSSGKLDRAALPAPDREASVRRPYRAPQTAAEELVASVWADVLGLESISADDDFFALGGHSLLATQVVVRLGAVVGLDVSLRSLFTHSTVAELAGEVERLLAADIAALTDDEALRQLDELRR